jgi:hypothetical protein
LWSYVDPLEQVRHGFFHAAVAFSDLTLPNGTHKKGCLPDGIPFDGLECEALKNARFNSVLLSPIWVVRKLNNPLRPGCVETGDELHREDVTRAFLQKAFRDSLSCGRNV